MIRAFFSVLLATAVLGFWVVPESSALCASARAAGPLHDVVSMLCTALETGVRTAAARRDSLIDDAQQAVEGEVRAIVADWIDDLAKAAAARTERWRERARARVLPEPQPSTKEGAPTMSETAPGALSWQP